MDITARVKALCETHTAPRIQAPGFAVPDFKRVFPVYRRSERRDSRQRGRGENRHEHMKVKASGLESFSLDRENVNVRYLEQLTDHEQTDALAYLLRYGLEQVIDGKKTVRQAVEMMMKGLDTRGWEAISGSYVPCGLARPRIQELYASLNRFRG